MNIKMSIKSILKNLRSQRGNFITERELTPEPFDRKCNRTYVSKFPNHPHIMVNPVSSPCFDLAAIGFKAAGQRLLAKYGVSIPFDFLFSHGIVDSRNPDVEYYGEFLCIIKLDHSIEDAIVIVNTDMVEGLGMPVLMQCFRHEVAHLAHVVLNTKECLAGIEHSQAFIEICKTFDGYFTPEMKLSDRENSL